MTPGEIATLVPALVALIWAAVGWLNGRTANRRIDQHLTGNSHQGIKTPGQ